VDCGPTHRGESARFCVRETFDRLGASAVAVQTAAKFAGVAAGKHRVRRGVLPVEPTCLICGPGDVIMNQYALRNPTIPAIQPATCTSIARTVADVWPLSGLRISSAPAGLRRRMKIARYAWSRSFSTSSALNPHFPSSSKYANLAQHWPNSVGPPKLAGQSMPYCTTDYQINFVLQNTKQSITVDA